jgi:hypothetical protein
LVWLTFCGAVIGQTWQTLRRNGQPFEWGLWCAILTILIAANFNVVLEGPMGAVPFWIMLGLANGVRSQVSRIAPANAVGKPEPALVEST